MPRDEGRPGSVSFVLRLWLESSTEGAPDWRWKVHHIQSGEERYFRTLNDVQEFVAECSRVAPPLSWPQGQEVSGEPTT